MHDERVVGIVSEIVAGITANHTENLSRPVAADLKIRPRLRRQSQNLHYQPESRKHRFTAGVRGSRQIVARPKSYDFSYCGTALEVHRGSTHNTGELFATEATMPRGPTCRTSNPSSRPANSRIRTD